MKNNRKNSFMIILSAVVLSSGISLSNLEYEEQQNNLSSNEVSEIDGSKYGYNTENILNNLEIMNSLSKNIKEGQILKKKETHQFIEEKSSVSNVDSLLVYVIFYNDLYVMSKDSDKDVSDEATFMYNMEEYIKEMGKLNKTHGDDALKKFVEKHYNGDKNVYNSIINVYETNQLIDYLYDIE